MKDIKDYLHLYLGCEIYDSYNDRTGILKGITKDSVLIDHKTSWRLDFDEVKPILRPLSDMTEEEKIEYGETFKEVKPFFGGDSVYFESHETVRWLLSKHFDLFGLIEAGLAIDGTKMKVT